MAPDASALTSSPDLAPGYAPYRRGATVDVHSEAVFRYFLNIERKRAEQAGRSVVLVLVSIRSTPGRSLRLAPRTASAIVSALGSSVREVDFVGWFRDGHVAAAALAQQRPPQRSAIAARVEETLKRELRDASAMVKLRVVSLGAARR
jgi:hypothetical protein